MSQENVEAIERGYEALSRLDAEALVALCGRGSGVEVEADFFHAIKGARWQGRVVGVLSIQGRGPRSRGAAGRMKVKSL
jgi:hypothetical protein